ncbi:MAG: chorismate synthase [Chlamydiales bacterium]|jgi:chorismate synthase|nr:chorismate synthase [Chlamydiales bacterium]
MASNSFGTLLRMTTWGESHGRAIGVVIDGCPAGLPLNDEEINLALKKRAPGKNPYVSPRKELDRAEIYSGLFEGKTTGSPISIVILNQDHDSKAYESNKHLLRPGHANFTYLQKYGAFDYRGGGRASARETACRVAAGVVAKKILKEVDVEIVAYVREIGGISISPYTPNSFHKLREAIDSSPLFCPHPATSAKMATLVDQVKADKDSLGGVIECVTSSLPIGLGDPIYEKLEANLAKAMLSIPASKGFEFGSGFKAAQMKGSDHNDLFTIEKGQIVTQTNHAGGILAGITNGAYLITRTAFKPTSSIARIQQSVHLDGSKEEPLIPSEQARHDPCVAIRAAPVVEAMTAFVLADAYLMNRGARL